MKRLRYHAEAVFNYPERGPCVVVRLDRECDDFGWLLDAPVTVFVGPRSYDARVRGVERFMHCPPWREGEKISLLLGELSAGDKERLEQIARANP